MKRVLMPIGILVICILAAGIILRNPPTIVEVSPEIIPVAVRVIRAEESSVQLTVKSQGKVQAAQIASLSAAVAGPIDWISPSLEAGAHVLEGQILLRLDAGDYETARARSQASLQQAQAEADHGENELARLQELAEQRLASDSQLQDAKRLAAVSVARLAEAVANNSQAELDLSRTAIRAPFNAIIERREVELGQYVNRAQSVAVLYGADEVEVRIPLAIQQLGFLDVPLGTRGELSGSNAPDVTLTGLFGREEHQWVGKLVRTEATIDANSNTVQTIIRVHQPTAEPGNFDSAIALPIGLFVEADIAGRKVDNLISLPRSVIRNNNQVLVVDAENKMYYREVDIFRLEEEQVLISGGIMVGDLICISPIQAVVDGMSVEPIIEELTINAIDNVTASR